MGATAALAITLLLLTGFMGANLFVMGPRAAEVLAAAATLAEEVNTANKLASSSNGAEIASKTNTKAPMVKPTDTAGESTTRDASKAPSDAERGATGASKADGRIVLEFEHDAYALDGPVRDALRAALVAHSGRALSVTAQVRADSPASSKRAAFIRVMAVRNALLDLGFAADGIRPSVQPADSTAPTVGPRDAGIVVIKLEPRAPSPILSASLQKETAHAD